MKKFLFLVWLVAFTWLGTLFLSMMSEPNTTANIVGFLGYACLILATVYSRCFTRVPDIFKKQTKINNPKNQSL